MGRDYVVMPWVPASGSIKVLKYTTLNCIRSSMRWAPDSTSISELFHLVPVLRPSRYRIPKTVSANIVTDLQQACNTLGGTTENLCNGIYKSIVEVILVCYLQRVCTSFELIKYLVIDKQDFPVSLRKFITVVLH